MSDPSSMDKILTEHGLEDRFRVHRIMTLVDPVKFEGLSHVLNVIDRQVAAGDQILVNKVDLVSEEELEKVLSLLKAKCRAPVQKGSFGRFDYSFIHRESGRKPEAERESCNTPDTRPASLFLEGPVRSREALEAFMDKSAAEVYRIKGFIELEGRLRYISDNSRGFSINDAKKPDIRPGLTVLCPPESAGAVRDRWQFLVRKEEITGFRQAEARL
jgi:G3E family GTPase